MNYRLTGDRQSVFELNSIIGNLLDSYSPNLRRLTDIAKDDHENRIPNLSLPGETRYDEGSDLFLPDARVTCFFVCEELYEMRVERKISVPEVMQHAEIWYVNPDMAAIKRDPSIIISGRIPSEGVFSTNYAPMVDNFAELVIKVAYHIQGLGFLVDEKIQNLLDRAEGVRRVP